MHSTRGDVPQIVTVRIEDGLSVHVDHLGPYVVKVTETSVQKQLKIVMVRCIKIDEADLRSQVLLWTGIELHGEDLIVCLIEVVTGRLSFDAELPHEEDDLSQVLVDPAIVVSNTNKSRLMKTALT